MKSCQVLSLERILAINYFVVLKPEEFKVLDTKLYSSNYYVVKLINRSFYFCWQKLFTSCKKTSEEVYRVLYHHLKVNISKCYKRITDFGPV